MSGFIDTLSALCKEYLYKEKWLISPNRRAGFQIIDRISFQGQGIINLHVKTMSSMVMDIISEFMIYRNMTRIKSLHRELLMGELFHRLKEKSGGYLSRLKSSSGLFKSLISSLSELRNAGISAHQLYTGLFEEPAKGKEIIFLLSLYKKELEEKKYLDDAGALIQAIRIVKSGKSILQPEILILAPSDMITCDFTPLERQLWNAIPDYQKIEIKHEKTAIVQTNPESDLSLLRQITHPFDAPAPVKDGSVQFFKAYGAVNEVREVFRRIVHGDISFDQAEIIHTDSRTYVPLIFETAYQYPLDKDALDKDAMVRVTFADGIPAKYTRPGRALISWISWIENDYPQTILTSMIRDGLLHIDIQEPDDVNFSEFALLFRQIQIGKGKNRYKKVFEHYLYSLHKKQSHLSRSEEENEEKYEKKKDRLNVKCRKYDELKQVVYLLLENAPPGNASQKEIIEKAVWFMQTMVRCISKLDNYAADIIHQRLDELVGYMNENVSFTHFDVWNWLRGLAENTKVSGLGPREGSIYVTGIETGGFSGRPYTFIIGMDDSRFPGTGHYDPVLLDQERSDISKDLPLMADVPAKRILSIQRLFTRLKGNLTMSYSWIDIREDREMFPSQVLLSAYRIVSGNHEADQDDVAEVLRPSASFAPLQPEHGTTIDEWWLGTLCGEQKISNGREAVGNAYHHLARGFTAKEMRDSNNFTGFDGYVPDAGKNFNPYKKDGLILSVNMFELLAKSPLDFFFKYILCIEPLEDEEIDINIWLDSLSKGSLLHSVFQEFMIQIREKRELPSYKKHRELIHTILKDHIKRERDKNPPFHEYAYEQDLYLLQKAVDIFLNREEEFCISSIPSYFEVNIGIPYEGRVTVLDSKNPVFLQLSEDKTIRARARIDRIDKTADATPPVYSVWDYKTGRSRRYDRNDPFNKGRIVQNILYLLIAEQQLTGIVNKTASVSHFGYFFTSLSEMGQRISWPASVLKKGKKYLIALADMIKAGCFPCSHENGDLTFTDYKDALIDSEQTKDQAMKKIKNMENTVLEPMRRLREL